MCVCLCAHALGGLLDSLSKPASHPSTVSYVLVTLGRSLGLLSASDVKQKGRVSWSKLRMLIPTPQSLMWSRNEIIHGRPACGLSHKTEEALRMSCALNLGPWRHSQRKAEVGQVGGAKMV